MKKGKKFVQSGSIPSYLWAHYKLHRSQLWVDLVAPQDYTLEEPAQESQDQKHEVQMKQEVGLASEQQALEHAQP